MGVKYKISFTNRGFVICNSYEQRENGVYWKTTYNKGKNVHGELITSTLEGFSTNDLVKSIEEYDNN